MDFDPTAVKVAVIHWYALRIEALAVEALLTKSKIQAPDYNFNREKAILRKAVAELETLRFSDSEIDCELPLVPCEGFCVDDCPKPASSGTQSAPSGTRY